MKERMKEGQTRRQFLLTGAAGLAAAGMPVALFGSPALADARDRR